MSILSVVLAHREAQETFDRHLPYWKGWCDKILVVTPEDSQIQTSEMQISHGKACHVGEEATKRMRWMLRWLQGTDWTEVIVHEYDSIAFDRPGIFNAQDPASDYAIQGNWFHGEDSMDWLSSSFVHPPLAFKRTALDALVAALGAIPDHAEKGAWDRWLGLAIKQRKGMFMASYGKGPAHPTMFDHDFGRCGSGFAHNTIHPEHYPALAEAVRNGARFFHGVKSEAVLKIILENMK